MMRNDNKDTVIFIHGLGQTPKSWHKAVSFMSEHMTANYVDLPLLCDNKEITYNNLYHAFENYCEKTNGSLNLCGISLGAVLALNYAIDHAARVQSLVLISPQYKMPGLLLKFQNIIFLCMPEASFSKMGFQKNNIIRLSNSMTTLDFSNYIFKISCPTLIICGDKDKANKKAAKQLASNIPTAKIQWLKDTGHEANVEAPEHLAALLNSFLF